MLYTKNCREQWKSTTWSDEESSRSKICQAICARPAEKELKSENEIRFRFFYALLFCDYFYLPTIFEQIMRHEISFILFPVHFYGC